jgi:hypothetical protein
MRRFTRGRVLIAAHLAAWLVSTVAIASEPPLEFHVIFNVGFRAPQPVYATIHSQNEWTALLSTLKSDSLTHPSGSLPDIDFDKFTLLIASSGTKGNSGYSLAFNAARKVNGAIIVSVLDVSPGNCPTAQEITYPRIAALIPRTNDPVSFVVANVVRDCTKHDQVYR